MFDEHEPPTDRWDRAIRFAAGFVVGTIAGFVHAIYWDEIGDYFLLLALAEGVVMGFLAMRYGDRAWAWLRDRWF